MARSPTRQAWAEMGGRLGGKKVKGPGYLRVHLALF